MTLDDHLDFVKVGDAIGWNDTFLRAVGFMGGGFFALVQVGETIRFLAS